MTEDRTLKVNSHVSRLNRFLPFSAAHDQIYEEYQTGEDSLELSTMALHYARKAVAASATCIVLTGDAGHGKTHLCRRLIELELGYDAASSRKLLKTKCDASEAIPHASGCSTRRIRIHKDFSELDPKAAADLLESCSAKNGEVLVVCANEGRLRAIVQSERAGGVCVAIATLFDSSFRNGLSSSDGTIHIVNLNYQSIAATGQGERTGLLRRTLQGWAEDGRRWQGCTACSVADSCPIRRNRALLVEEGRVSAQRISRLEQMAEVVERLGHVITIREMLMLVSYLVTGGLVCENVHQIVKEQKGVNGWQHPWAFYNLLFDAPPDMSEDRLYKGIPVLSIFRRLDPGMIASREVDDRILNIGGIFQNGQLDLIFRLLGSGKEKLVDAAEGLDDFIGNPQSKSEQAREAELASLAVRALRRRAVFDDVIVGASLMSRLGFRHGDEFIGVINEQLSSPEQVRLKNLIIAGLHSIQGLRMSRSETTLHLVDPAFGRASDDAAIIARRIPASQLQLLPARNAWPRGQQIWSVCESVDWIDRTVVLRITDRDTFVTDIGLDLLSFECVTRSASGYVSEDFYAHEIRRVRIFLSKLATRGKANGSDITIFVDGKVQSISIDMGVIQVGGV